MESILIDCCFRCEHKYILKGIIPISICKLYRQVIEEPFDNICEEFGEA